MLPRMLAFALVVLMTGAAALPHSTTPASATPDPWFDEELRRWDWISPAPQTYSLVLAPSEEYDRYYFVLDNDPGPVSGTIAAGNIEITHAITGDTICGRAIASIDGEYKVNVPCHDLRIGHTYRVEVLLPTAATLYLFGEDV